MLAQAAKNANFIPLVVDLFADQDTQDIAEKVIQLKDLSLSSLRPEVLSLQAEYTIQVVVYGSGLEDEIESLIWLESQYQIYGNSAAVNASYCDNKRLFQHLDQLNIPYPKVSFVVPDKISNYLKKSSKSSGGQGVAFNTDALNTDEYYQQYQKGESGSVLFLAAKQGIQIIGFHRQWTVSAKDFSFAGIIKQNILPAKQAHQVAVWLNELVKIYDFKGLGSLDFIWDGKQCYFLEINCRPPASMMLYPELDLLSTHISEEFVLENLDPTIKGLQVIYAVENCLIEMPKWPKWSFDRPKNTTRIQSGQPICSIMADGKSVLQVEGILQDRKIFIQNNVIK